jgi:NADH:ubiquinone oxidoreductase subunit 3 (subunit A)
VEVGQLLISLDLVIVIWSVIFFVLAFYFLAGRLGKVSTGTGAKYDAFAGGEELPPERGKYNSELFVYAALFVAFEVIGLLLASSISARGFLWPLLFTLSGGFSLFVMMVWFVGTGGAELA